MGRWDGKINGYPGVDMHRDGVVVRWNEAVSMQGN